MSGTGVPFASRHHLVTFQVASHGFAIPSAVVEEVLPMVQLTVLPGQSATVDGLLDFEGEAVPVFCTARLLELPAAPPEVTSHLLLLRTTRGRRVLRVDRVCELLTLPPAALLSHGQGSGQIDCFAGQVDWHEQTYLVVRPESLMDRAHSAVGQTGGLPQVEPAGRP
jgi:chemotaxis signal transduction protein